jgi:DNA-binding NarL/FixJ family response regulator
MKILVIDDHLIVREGLAALLMQAQPGTVIVHACDAAEGLAKAEFESSLDAAFLDLNLSGASAMSAIREFTMRCPNLPVIILSSSESPADVRRALSLGALGYVPKSASPQTLISALKLVLSGNIYLPPLMLDDPAPGAGGRVVMDGGALTGRQVEVLSAICKGLSNKEIGRQLDLSEKTVKAHVSAIFRVLNVVNRTQAANAARASGLVDG